MKGKISKNLESILQDENGRKQLRRSLVKRRDSTIRSGVDNYRVSSKNVVCRSSKTGKAVEKNASTSARSGRS